VVYARCQPALSHKLAKRELSYLFVDVVSDWFFIIGFLWRVNVDRQHDLVVFNRPDHLDDGFLGASSHACWMFGSMVQFRLVGYLVGWMDGWMDGCLVIWLFGLLVGWMFVWLFGLLVGWMGVCLFDF
jgi:hypothetical protein